MGKIDFILKKIQEIQEQKNNVHVLDIDLMLDFTRSLYATLLNERARVIASGANTDLAASDLGSIETNAYEENLNDNKSIDEVPALDEPIEASLVEENISTEIEDKEDLGSTHVDEDDSNLPESNSKEEEATIQEVKNSEDDTPSFSEPADETPSTSIEKEVNEEEGTKDEEDEIKDEEETPQEEESNEINEKTEEENIAQENIEETEYSDIDNKEYDIQESKLSKAASQDITFDQPNFDFKEIEIEKPTPSEPKVITEINLELPIRNENKTSSTHTKAIFNKLKQKDIRSFIGINDKYQFTNELFGNNKENYEKNLDKIANFNSLKEAKDWLIKTATKEFNWDKNDDTFLELLSITEKYFAA
ncbi:MAG TPA: hypothetical protein VLZ83_03775 [Edaphocola sp.]|nr:hypothetical protein [Edaphocola sp.]